MPSVCPHCNGPIAENEAYDACANCGRVMNMGQLVSDSQFETTSGGGSRATGQFVSSLRSQRDYSGGGRLSASGRDSRANTEEKGRVFITSYAATLGLQRLVEAARLLFQTVVQQNFIQGRKTNLVAAACLYIACRRDASSPMMLIDFSPILETNIYEFGQTVMSVRSKLAAELPVIDPVHYIERFAARLSLGTKTQMVCNTALQVVRRLSRDWLQTGRRPSGITGVALYIAAHMHGLNPSMVDLVKEMHVCDSTLRKRLTEFLDTPAAELPRTEFESLAEQEFDNVLPPVMRAPRVLKSELEAAVAAAAAAAKRDDDDDNDDDDLLLSQSDGGLAARRSKKLTVDDDDDDDGDNRSSRADDYDDDDDDVMGNGNGKKPLRRVRKRELSPTSSGEPLRRRKREPDESSNAQTTDDEASASSRKKRRSAARSRRRATNAALAAAAISESKAKKSNKVRTEHTIDGTTIEDMELLSLAEVRAELDRRGCVAHGNSATELRHALFVDNVDRQSLLASLSIADLRALAENRFDASAPLSSAAPPPLLAADDKGDDAGAAPATTLPADEQRRLLDLAQRALRQTVERELSMMHETRKQLKAQEEEQQQKLAEQRRLQAAQRDAALTNVAAATSSQRASAAASKKRPLDDAPPPPPPSDATADTATAASALTTAASSTSTTNNNNATTGDGATSVVEPIVGDDIDEEEIGSYLLTPAEVRLRSQIWHQLNKEYLDEQRAKQEIEDQLRAQGKQPRKRNNKRREATTASQAAHEALGRTSNKINYDVLQKLLDPSQQHFPPKKTS